MPGPLQFAESALSFAVEKGISIALEIGEVRPNGVTATVEAPLSQAHLPSVALDVAETGTKPAGRVGLLSESSRAENSHSINAAVSISNSRADLALPHLSLASSAEDHLERSI